MISSLRPKAALLAAGLSCALVWASAAAASQVWAEVGDGRLRSDLQLLADSGVIELPLADWPVPMADISRAMGGIEMSALDTPALRDAYDRIEKATAPTTADYLHLDSVGIAGGEPGLLRDFDTPARENGDVSVGIADYGDRWAAELKLTYAISPRDHQPVRLDGSNVTLRLGNWLISANTLDKWWGPGYESSLILSNNARPMPALMLERATAVPFRTPLLHWLGPWRFIFYVAQMDANRPDVENPLFLGERLSFMPWSHLTIGLSRTAEWCGAHRGCGLTMFKNLLLFNDTVGDTLSVGTPQPGNEEAGYDVRLSSPWRAVPLAAYIQFLGEDEIHRLPARIMRQYGLEGWYGLSNGDMLRGFIEYTDSTCGAGRNPPQYFCAYEHSVFFEGYRYRDLPIGSAADADSILRTVGLRWVRHAGDEWQLKLQNGHFNRGDVVHPYDPVSGAGSSLYESAQVEYRRRLFGGDLRVQLGAERQRPPEAIANGRGFGYITWSKAL